MLPSTLRLTLFLSFFACYCHAQTIQICNDEPTAAPTHITPDCYEGVRIEAAGDPNCPTGEATVLSGDDINFFATESITLNAGFSTEVGATFRAEVVESLNNGCAVLNQGLCGVFEKATQPPLEDIVAYDRFGNGYTEAELIGDASSSSSAPVVTKSVNTGYFRLRFRLALPVDQFNLIEQVFTDISQQIPRRNNTLACGDTHPNDAPVIIDILSNDNPNLSVIASASPIYNNVQVPNGCNEMRMNRVWQKINGGNIPLVNNTARDGFITVRDNINWHTDTSTPNPQDFFDMYSVILHEALHILGFASQIGADTAPTGRDNYYSRWDQLLYRVSDYNTGGGTDDPSPQSFLISNCQDNCWAFNQSIISNDLRDLTNNCQNNQFNVVGDNALAPVGGSFAINDSDENALRNYFSHLNETCAGQNEQYVMNPGFPPDAGNTRRVISDAELNILCELGYQTSACDGCYAYAQDEADFLRASTADLQSCCYKEYLTKIGQPVDINTSDLLCNDFTNGNGGNLTVTDITLASSGASLTNTPTGVRFAANQPGRYTIRYTVAGCNCFLTSATLLVIVKQNLPNCPTPACEDLFCYATFEDINNLNGDYYRSTNYDNYFIFSGNATMEQRNTVDFFSENNGNKFLRIAHNSGNTEGIAFELSSPIGINCTANINFAVSGQQLGGPTDVQIFGSELHPCLPSENAIPEQCGNGLTVDCGSYNYQPYCVAENLRITDFTPDGDRTNINFGDYAVQWTNNTGQPINYLIFSAERSTQRESVFYLDDVEVDQTCPFAISVNALDAPFSSCPDQITNVSYEICSTAPAGGNTQKVLTDITFPNEIELAPNQGNLQLVTLAAGECKAIKYNFIANANAVAGATYDINIEVRNSGNCNNGSINQNFGFTIENNCPTAACFCTGNNRYNLKAEDGLLLSESALPSGGVQNACISVAGKLILDVNNYQFNNCEFIMHSGAELVVPTNISSVFSANNFHGCNEMWRGITVATAGELTFTNNNIQDAQYALALNADVVMQVEQNTFDRNYIGIYVPPSMDGSTQNIGFATPLKGNTFTCSSNLLPPYSGQTPTPSEAWSYAGLQITNAALIVGSSGDPNSINYFNNIRIGIDATNSLLNIYYVRMEDSFTPVASPSTHRGIVSNGGLILVRNSYFEQFGIAAILVTNGYLAAEYNELICSANGIVHQGALSNSFIRHNEISTSDGAAIYLLSPTAARCEINNNTITQIVSGNNGIEGINILNTPNNQVEEIFDNHITITTGVGIIASGVRNADFINNTIELHNSSNPANFGIDVIDTENSVFRDNSIQGTDDAIYAEFTGLRISGSPNNQYCCTTIDKIEQAVEIDGFCDDSKLRHTFFEDNTRGLLCAAGTVIGAQVHAGNLWLEDYSENGAALHLGDLNEKLASQFLVQDGDPSTAAIDRIPPYWPPVQNQDFDWFVDDDGQAVTCTTDSECDNVNLLTNLSKSNVSLSAYEWNRIVANAESAAQRTMLEWESDRHLFRKLLATPSLRNLHSNIETFYQKQLGTPLVVLKEVETAITDLNTTDLANWTQQMDSYTQIATQISQLDRDSLSTTNGSSSPTAMSRRLVWQSEQNVIAEQLIQEFAEWTTTRNQAITDIQNLNQSFTTNSVFANNEQVVNKVYLETLAQGVFNLDSEQLAVVSPIAHQCVSEGGRGVLLARFLYQLYKTKEFDDEELCKENLSLDEKINSNLSKSVQSNFLVDLFPNPTQEIFNVQLDIKDLKGEHDLEIQIFTLTGKMMLKKPLSIDQNNEIRTKNLGRGIYYCLIKDQHKTIATKKLVIIK